jgi:hypothetical protein
MRAPKKIQEKQRFLTTPEIHQEIPEQQEEISQPIEVPEQEEKPVEKVSKKKKRSKKNE